MPEVMIRGVRTHYLKVAGPSPAKGPKIVLVHGGGGNAGIWRKVMEGLGPICGSLAVDLPGHGESGGEGLPRIPEYRDFLREFLEELGLGEILLGGHSMGGGVVLDFALHWPRRIASILLVGAGARLRVLPEGLEIMRRMAAGEVEPRFEPWAFAPGADPEVIAEGAREWAQTSPRVRYHDFLACDRFDLIAELGRIHLPALIVCGRNDRLTPLKYSEFLNQRIPGSRMEIVERAGHMVMLEAPAALRDALAKNLSYLFPHSSVAE